MTQRTKDPAGWRMADGRVVRAVILDVYHTLLHVEAGPEDAAERWERLCREVLSPAPAETLAAAPVPALAEFNAACRREVAGDHRVKNAAGILWPEVDWRSVVRRAWPVLAALTEEGLDSFLAAHAGLARRCSVMPGALNFLETIKGSRVLAGIASNAQRYTLHELQTAGIPVKTWFDNRLCFWSWREGFSKPDPGVFRILSARLAACGISPEETLMIGDRADNDILPAQAAGWKTWHFTGSWPG